MIVIDPSALAAILFQEEDAPLYAEGLAAANRRVMSTASGLEAASVVLGRLGDPGLAGLDEFLTRAQIEMVSFDMPQLRVAIDARRVYGRGSGHPARLNLGDCFAYALAKTRDLPLLFKGDDFIHTDIRSAIAES